MDYMTIKEASKVGQEKLEELGAGHEGHVDHSNMVADFKKRFIVSLIFNDDINCIGNLCCIYL